MRMRERSQGKNEKRTETEKEEYYWRAMDARVKKWYIQEEEERAQETQADIGT